MLFILSHKGAMECFGAMTAISHECAVVGVPKTIDNDIQILDRSFGFDTACTEAIGGSHSSNTTCLTHVFFKPGE